MFSEFALRVPRQRVSNRREIHHHGLRKQSHRLQGLPLISINYSHYVLTPSVPDVSNWRILEFGVALARDWDIVECREWCQNFEYRVFY